MAPERGALRLRTDSLHVAGWKRAHTLRGCQCGPEKNHIAHKPKQYPDPPAEEGDVWTNLGWQGRPELAGGDGLTCPEPTCEEGAHRWWHAYDCPAGRNPDGVCKAGAGRTSCWTWIGSPEAGDLTASPSLHVLKELGGCGWHGWLRNGEMVLA